jgi:hypothetical protein
MNAHITAVERRPDRRIGAAHGRGARIRTAICGGPITVNDVNAADARRILKDGGASRQPFPLCPACIAALPKVTR